MTVREARKALIGPADKFSVEVAYESETYDITEESPVLNTFADYVVESISAPAEFQYTIFLKREYVKEEKSV